MNKHQNKIEKLIEKLCPDGVEFRELGKILKRNKGTKITASQMKVLHKKDAPIKIFAGGKTFAMVDFDDIPEKDIHNIPSIIVKSRGVIEFEYYNKLFSHKGEFWSYYSNNKEVDIKYIYYYLKHKEVYFQVLASKMQMPQISLPDTEKFKIPIPPIKIQKEIVKILDNFTELEADLEADLEAELEARQKQYEYYRDEMLSFDNDEVEFKELGEIGDVAMCKRIFKNQTSSDGDIPFFTIGTFGKQPNSFIPEKVYSEYRAKYSFPKKGDVLLSASGTIGRLVIYDGEPAYFQDSNIIWLKNDESEVLNKFLYYFYTITKWKTEGGTIKRLYNKNFKKVKIPIPSIEKQKEIVETLDKFNALTNNISIGLPAEIKARRQQYEYYREKLLTFKELEKQHDK